jgi:hypothetical protein
MTAIDQLDFVEQYLLPFKGRMSSLSDVYMTILSPAAVGKPDSPVLFSSPSRAYTQNAGLAVCGKTGKFELLPFRMELCAGGSVGSAYKALSRVFTEVAYAATNFGMRIRL